MIRPPYSPDPLDALWQEALAELRLQMPRATFNNWLADSHTLPTAGTSNFLVIVVRNIYAWEWLTYRLYLVIGRTVTDVAGGEVAVCFVPKVVPRSYHESSRRPPSRICFGYAQHEPIPI